MTTINQKLLFALLLFQISVFFFQLFGAPCRMRMWSSSSTSQLCDRVMLVYLRIHMLASVSTHTHTPVTHEWRIYSKKIKNGKKAKIIQLVPLLLSLPLKSSKVCEKKEETKIVCLFFHFRYFFSCFFYSSFIQRFLAVTLAH